MKDELKRKKLLKENGITLVVLVITIIILIIVSTITITAIYGENGLINQSKNSKENITNLIDKENNELKREEQTYINVMEEEKEIETPFIPGPTPEPPTGGQEMSDMTNGVIEIKWLSETSNNVSETPNAPVVKNPSNGTMELVKFDRTNKKWVSGADYSYLEGIGSNDNNASKWANARVTINGVDSYFVWIPRYAYRIIYFDSAESKKAYQEGTLTEADAVADGKIIGYSDSRGIVDASGKKINSIASTTKTMVSEDYFMVHPAFMDGTSTGFQNGEWNAELPGIWVGKYETSGSSTQLKVQPGVSSLRSTTIGNMYTYSINYSKDLKSHMLKNSEWGAVAYLTESKYGRNGTEIEFSDDGYITGGGTGTAYSDTNKLQSSTGNEYGIYDLRGGSWEYVAGYYKDVGSYISNASSFADGTSDEYSTAYDSEGSISYNKYYKYGDATMETKKWHSDDAVFVLSGDPFFLRGGGYYSSPPDGTGVFDFLNDVRKHI